MKFDIGKPVKIVMLGAGGTGGYIAPHLYRLLYTLDRTVKIIIADGDIVEQKNLVRQNFIRGDIGKNKAQVLAERYACAFGMEILYVPEFIENEDKLANLISSHHGSKDEITILIGAVDNNKSRQLCHKIFEQSKDLIYIDSGNGEYTGQVVCGIRSEGHTYYKPIGDLYPDVLEDTDKFPTELSCAEAAVSAPQSIVANITAATAVVSYLYNILVLGNIEVSSTTFSTKTINVRPTITRKRKVA